MIMENVKYFGEQLDGFQGVKGCKEYKFLEEHLTQSLVALENIDPKGMVFQGVEYLFIRSFKKCNHFDEMMEF